MDKYNIGDTVILKNSTIPMTVIRAEPNSINCVVVWFTNDRVLQTAKFPHTALRPYADIVKKQTEIIRGRMKDYWEPKGTSLFEHMDEVIRMGEEMEKENE